MKKDVICIEELNGYMQIGKSFLNEIEPFRITSFFTRDVIEKMMLPSLAFQFLIPQYFNP